MIDSVSIINTIFLALEIGIISGFVFSSHKKLDMSVTKQLSLNI